MNQSEGQGETPQQLKKYKNQQYEINMTKGLNIQRDEFSTLNFFLEILVSKENPALQYVLNEYHNNAFKQVGPEL